MLQKIKLNYFLIPLLLIITGSAATYFAQTGRLWYKTINFPIWIWTPSNTIMEIAWAVIFILSSFAVLIVWNRYSEQRNFKLIITLFILTAVINVGWYISFFAHQQIGLAFLQEVLLVSNLILLIVLIWKFCPLAATCLLPYSIWVIFSTVLTFNFWLMN